MLFVHKKFVLKIKRVIFRYRQLLIQVALYLDAALEVGQMTRVIQVSLFYQVKRVSSTKKIIRMTRIDHVRLIV